METVRTNTSSKASAEACNDKLKNVISVVSHLFSHPLPVAVVQISLSGCQTNFPSYIERSAMFVLKTSALSRIKSIQHLTQEVPSVCDQSCTANSKHRFLFIFSGEFDESLLVVLLYQISILSRFHVMTV